MTAPQVYFGNLRAAGWIKAPDTGLDASPTGGVDSMSYGGGGAFISNSAATHRKYNFSWSIGQESEFQFLWNYRNGLLGTGLLYWVDPYVSDQNAMPPHWAAPFLTGAGWPSLVGGGNDPTKVAATSALNNNPIYSAQYAIATPPNTIPDRALVLLIPPTMQLSLGFSGSAANGGVVRAQPILLNGTNGSTTDMTLLSASGTTRMNLTYSGATYRAVKIYLTSTVSGTATVTLDSGDAIYSLIGTSPTLTGNHKEGRGHTGLRFNGDPSLAYTLFDPDNLTRRFASAAASFEEIGGWL